MSNTSSSTTLNTIDPALEECDVPCVPSFRKNTTPSVEKKCNSSQLTKEKCYTVKERDKIFYDAIDWNRLHAQIKPYMELFLERLSSRRDIQESIHELYQYGPGHGTFLRLAIVEKDDYTHCKDLLAKIEIFRGAVKGKQKQVLAHISLHPQTPKYIRNTRRSRSGCGYYEKSETNACHDEETATPFHYVIETTYWGMKEFRCENKFRPEAALLTDPTQPGMFLPFSGDFVNLMNSDFTNSRSAKIENITPEWKAKINTLHKTIMNEFISFWNTVMLVGVEATETTPKLNSIRKTSGGKRRKTRRRKH